MCGRIRSSSRATVMHTFSIAKVSPRLRDVPLKPYPGDFIHGIVAHHDARSLLTWRWGFDVAGNLVYNARVESLGFVHLWHMPWYEHQRGIVPVEGFFEKGIEIETGPVGLAAIYSSDPLAGCLQVSIITMPSQGDVAKLHKRMPVVLPKRYHELWLSDTKIYPDEIPSMHELPILTRMHNLIP